MCRARWRTTDSDEGYRMCVRALHVEERSDWWDGLNETAWKELEGRERWNGKYVSRHISVQILVSDYC